MSDDARERVVQDDASRSSPGGRLVMIVGPSGAGKDTLLRFARTHLQDRTDIVFPRRVITRPPEPTEDHETVSIDEFAHLCRIGAFALTWQAHNLHYGVPVAIADDLAAGRTVVVNVSRGVIQEARSRFAVFVIAIEADEATRATRLIQRARESSDDRAERLTRAGEPISADVVIVNETSLITAGQELVRLIAAS